MQLETYIKKVHCTWRPTPVSYTHLDVYKRQVHDRSDDKIMTSNTAYGERLPNRAE